MYGKRKSFKGSTSNRTGTLIGKRVLNALKKVGTTYKKSTVKTSYSKDEEKKYNDRAIGAGFTGFGFGNNNVSTAANAITSVGFKTDSWYGFNFNQPAALGSVVTQDLLKGIATGTTTTSRIGNKIKPKYLKGTILLSANQENTSDTQNGEEVVNMTVNGLEYMRTTWRIVIVKDTQSNSTDVNITWDQVFSNGSVKTNEVVGGINSELNIGNMGRFIILSDTTVELTAADPQRYIKFMIEGSKIGQIRYNGPSDTALTDKGVYVIAANASTGTYPTTGVMYPGLCAVQSRLCFVDD